MVTDCTITMKGSGGSHWAECDQHGKIRSENGPAVGSATKVQGAINKHLDEQDA